MPSFSEFIEHNTYFYYLKNNFERILISIEDNDGLFKQLFLYLSIPSIQLNTRTLFL